MSLTRRDILRASVASAVAAGATILPTSLLAANKTVKIGMNIANDINAAGGVSIGGEKYNIEMVAYDHAYDTEKAVQGYKKLVLQDKVKMVMMLLQHYIIYLVMMIYMMLWLLQVKRTLKVMQESLSKNG